MKRNIFLSLTAATLLIFTGCSSKNENVGENQQDTLSIISKHMKQDIMIVKKCETTNIELSNSTQKIKTVNSTISNGKEVINLDYEVLKSGNKSEISYCKINNDKLEVKLDINLFNKYEFVDDGDKILIPNYKHNSTIILERSKPVTFQDFEIVWTYK